MFVAKIPDVGVDLDLLKDQQFAAIAITIFQLGRVHFKEFLRFTYAFDIIFLPDLIHIKEVDLVDDAGQYRTLWPLL